MVSKAILKSEMLHRRLCASSSPRKIVPFLCLCRSPYSYIQVRTYVEVYMKWKKDPYFDSIESVLKSHELKPIISVKNFFISSSSSEDNYSIPISAVTKKGSDFGISIKVARFLRSYPSFFEEFTGPCYNLPWFRLTEQAINLHKEEMMVYDVHRSDIVGRLKKLILMSGSRKVLPLKAIKGLRWQLGLPDKFWDDPLNYVGGYVSFEILDMEDGLKGLAVVDNCKNDKILAVLQKNAMRKGIYKGEVNEPLAFPVFPSKGLRLKRKIKDWLDEFQRLPYVSPYDDASPLNPDSNIAEKHVLSLLHEVWCLFVENAAERKSVFCLRKYMGLPQKVHKAFERHPYVFYLSLKNKTCTAILKEAYCDRSAIEPHPLANVRQRYIELMKESNVILRNKRMRNHKGIDQKHTKELSSSEDEISHLHETCE